MHEQLTDSWNRVSLRAKITGVTALLLTLGLLVAGAGTMSVLGNYLLDEVDAKLGIALAQIDDSIINISGTAPNLRCDIALPFSDYFIAVVTPEGELLCSNRDNASHPVVDELTSAFVAPHDTAFTLPSSAPGSQWRVMAYLAPTTASDVYYTVAVGLDLKDTNGIVARYAAIFLFFGLTVVILGGALTRLLVTSTFGPLREVEATAARFADGDFSQRLGGATPNTEVGRLNHSLNSMLNRIDRAFADRARTIEQMRRFVGDASHELRTPLVSVRGYAELYRMGALTKPEDVAQAMERIEKEAIRMGELVEDLLELARIDEAKPLHLVEVDLVPLAHDAALDAMASAPDRIVTVVVPEQAVSEDGVDESWRAQEPIVPVRSATLATGPIAFAEATLARLRARRTKQAVSVGANVAVPEAVRPSLKTVVWAEENKIRQVLTNLIGNAMRFTPDGSPIEIGVEVDRGRRLAILSVIDHGEGIPPQIRGKIFQRFWRADNSRNRGTGGSGLGLAIVSAIVEAHKGAVEVVETPGGGATFRVALPVLKPEQDPMKSTTGA